MQPTQYFSNTTKVTTSISTKSLQSFPSTFSHNKQFPPQPKFSFNGISHNSSQLINTSTTNRLNQLPDINFHHDINGPVPVISPETSKHIRSKFSSRDPLPESSIDTIDTSVAPIVTLIDSGSNLCVVDSDFATNYPSHIRTLDRPIKALLLDGFAKVKQYLYVKIQGDNGLVKCKFYLHKFHPSERIQAILSHQKALELGYKFLKPLSFTFNGNNTQHLYEPEAPIHDYINYISDDIKLEDLPHIPNKNIREWFINNLIDYAEKIKPKHRWDVGHIKGEDFYIDLVPDAKPVNQKHFILNPTRTKELNRQIEILLQHGLVRLSNSPWASPAFVIPKPDGNFRLCVDYRVVNALTVPLAYPIRSVQELIHRLQGKSIFTSLDLVSGYHHIKIAEKCRKILAFKSDLYHVEWNVLPFGPSNAPAHFQRVMNYIFKDLDFVTVYIDDILIASENQQQHKKHLRLVFKKLLEFNLKLNLKKCKIAVSSLKYMGYEINGKGLKPLPEYIKKLLDIPTPKNIKEVERLLGLVQFLGWFIPDLQKVARPISILKQKDKKFKWNKEQAEALKALKLLIYKSELLHFPDHSRPFIITVDASDIGIGAALLQRLPDGKLVINEFFSKLFVGPQIRWSIQEKELYAVIAALEHWRSIILPHHNLVLCDNLNVASLFKMKNPPAKFYRWSIRLSEFSFTVTHLQGRKNLVSDYLSRDHNKYRSEFHQLIQQEYPSDNQVLHHIYQQQIQKLQPTVPYHQLLQLKKHLPKKYFQQHHLYHHHKKKYQQIKVWNQSNHQIQHHLHSLKVHQLKKNHLKRYLLKHQQQKYFLQQQKQYQHKKLRKIHQQQHHLLHHIQTKIPLCNICQKPLVFAHLQTFYQRHNVSCNNCGTMLYYHQNKKIYHCNNNQKHSFDLCTLCGLQQVLTDEEHLTRSKKKKVIKELTNSFDKRNYVYQPKLIPKLDLPNLDKTFPTQPSSSTLSHDKILATDELTQYESFVSQLSIHELTQSKIRAAQNLDLQLKLIKEYLLDPDNKVYLLDKLPKHIRKDISNDRYKIDSIFGLLLYKKFDKGISHSINLLSQLNISNSYGFIHAINLDKLEKDEWNDLSPEKQQKLIEKEAKRLKAKQQQQQLRQSQQSSSSSTQSSRSNLNNSLNSSSPQPFYTVVIPKKLVDVVLKYYHDTSHWGYNKLSKIIYKKYYWPGYLGDISHFTRTCLACQRSKVTKHPYKNVIKTFPAESLNHIISIDFCGPYTPTNNDNIGLLTVQDRFTKYALFIPVPDVTAATTVIKLFNQWFLTYGFPEHLLSDQGSNFKAELTRICTSTFGTRQLFTSPYTPSTNGSNERIHRFINQRIRTYSAQQKRDFTKNPEWDTYIPFIQYLFNNSYNRSIGCTPFQAMFGRTHRDFLDLELQFKQLNKRLEKDDDLTTFFDTQQKFLQKVHQKIIKSQKSYDHRRKQQFLQHQKKHKRYKKPKFEIHDLVLLYSKPARVGVAAKWIPFYEQPFKVIEIINENSMKIQNTKDLDDIRPVNNSQVKPYLQN